MVADVVWLRKDGSLVCDLCKRARIDLPGPRALVIQEARRLHWKVVDTRTLGGDPFSSHVCAECALVKREPKVERLEGEEPLF